MLSLSAIESEAEAFLQNLNAIIVEAGTIDLKEVRNHYESLFLALKQAYVRENGLDKLYQELAARHETVVADLESVQSSNDCIASEIKKLQSLNDSANERECSSTATIIELKEELHNTRSRLAASEKAFDCRDSEAKQLSNDVTGWKQSADIAGDRIISLELEHCRVKSQLEQFQVSQRNLLEQNCILNELISEKNDEITHKNELRVCIQKELDSVQHKLQYKTQEFIDLQYASSVCRSKAAATETSLVETKKIAALTEQDLEREKALSEKLSSEKYELKETLSSQSNQISQLRCEISKIIEDQRRIMSEKSQLEFTLEVEREAVLRLEKVVDDANAATRLSNDEAQVISKEVERLRTKDKDASEEIHMLKQKNDLLLDSIRKTEEMLRQTNSKIQEKENIIESMEQKLAEARDATMRQELLCRGLVGECSILRQQGEEVQLTLQRLRDELKRMEDQTQVLSNIVVEKQSEAVVSNMKHDSISNELIDVMKGLALTQKALFDAEEEKIHEHRLMDALRSDLSEKESELQKLQTVCQGEKTQHELYSVEISKLKELLSEHEESLRTHQVEVMRLNAAVRELEESALVQTKECDRVMNERDVLGSSLIRRNDELALLYEKIKILHNNRLRGEIQYNAKLDDIRILKIKVRELQKRSSDQAGLEDLSRKFLLVQKELMREKLKGKALSDELENPINVHRWHMLEGSDPEAYDMIQKMQILQKRLLQTTEEVMVKNSIIQEQERQQMKLKKALARRPGPEIVEQLHNVQQDVIKKVKQMTAMAGELNMNKTEVSLQRIYVLLHFQASKLSEGMSGTLGQRMQTRNRAISHGAARPQKEIL